MLLSWSYNLVGRKLSQRELLQYWGPRKPMLTQKQRCRIFSQLPALNSPQEILASCAELHARSGTPYSFDLALAFQAIFAILLRQGKLPWPDLGPPKTGTNVLKGDLLTCFQELTTHPTTLPLARIVPTSMCTMGGEGLRKGV